MANLSVDIEISGVLIPVGRILGATSDLARFEYFSSYIYEQNGKPISFSLPIQEAPFSPEQTRAFFEGLLPEGRTRQSIANAIHVDEDDYVSLLALLGDECFGALRITPEGSEQKPAAYSKLDYAEILDLAQNGFQASSAVVAQSRFSLPGSTSKVGLYYDPDNGGWFLPLGSAPSTHIVKQGNPLHKNTVINEQLCMMTAANLGLETSDSFIATPDKSDSEDILFATARFDRMFGERNQVVDGLAVPFRLHQEDFAQALGIPSSRKSEPNGEHYLKRMFDLLRTCSPNPVQDQSKLWLLCIFNWLIGNCSNNIKNVSLLYSDDLGYAKLSPAYDIICTRMYPENGRQMSISIDGIYDIENINREHFEAEAKLLGFGKKLAMQIFDAVNDQFKSALNKATEELVAYGYPEAERIASAIL